MCQGRVNMVTFLYSSGLYAISVTISEQSLLLRGKGLGPYRFKLFELFLCVHYKNKFLWLSYCVSIIFSCLES
jgi:hypothetical protein